MQVTETVSDGLKREFKVVVPAADLATKADVKLSQLKDQVRLNGFRPGKVPVAHIKRLYGRAVMAEMIETTMREANAEIVTERGFKLVREPKVTLPEEQGAVEQVIAGKSDLAYTMAIEILPTIELADFKGIQLERMNARNARWQRLSAGKPLLLAATVDELRKDAQGLREGRQA